MEENISNARDVWVEETMREALQNDCVGGKCGVLGASRIKPETCFDLSNLRAQWLLGHTSNHI